MRVKDLMRNSFFSVFSQFVLIIFGFLNQRVLNIRLGEALVGLNGVAYNTVSIMSVTDLGIATAIVYNLYRALAGGDEREIAGLMNLYRRAYYAFAAGITLIGLLIMPFLPKLLKDNPFTMGYVRLIYLLWLFRTVLSYLLSYRRSILIADQREYIVSIAVLLTSVVNYSLIILIVSYKENYALALAVNIAIDIVSNLWISWYVNKKYPYLQRLRKELPERAVCAGVFRNIKNIFIVRLSNKLLTATDSVIISGFIGVTFAGLYSNYYLIISALSNIATALSGAIQPSVGTEFAHGGCAQGEKMLRLSTFLFFLMAASVSCGVYAVANPFVGDWWLGKGYMLAQPVIAACVLNFFLMVLSLPIGMVMSVTGLFERERNLAVVSAASNIVLSLILVGKWGIFGVVAGTSAAYLVQMCYRIYVFYRIYLNSSMRCYVAELMQYVVLGLAEIALIHRISGAVYGGGGLWRFALLCLVSVGLPLALNLALYFRSRRLHGLISLVRQNDRQKQKAKDVGEL